MRDSRIARWGGAAVVAAILVTTSLVPAPAVAATASPPSLALHVDLDGGDPMTDRCSTVARACTIEGRARVTLDVRTGEPGAFTGARLRLERSWREPGTRRLRPRAPYRVTLGAASLAASIPLERAVTDPGLWCLRAVVDTGAGTEVQSQLRCVRWRPEIEVGWAGDIVVGSHYGLPPNGGRDQLARVDHLLRVPDLMVGNYEGTLSRGGSPRCSGGPPCFIFQAPPDRARNLAVAGFDVLSLANNHALDMGEGARRQSVRAIERYGMRAAGLPGQVTYVQVADTLVGIVGFSPYPGTTNMRSLADVHRLVRSAARADVVVATFHAGLEGARGAHVPRGLDFGTDTRAAVHAAVDAGADVVFGSGPHVVRGIERYRGAFIAYSSGNFAGWHNFALVGPTRQSGVVRVTFDHRGRSARGAWDPVVIDPPGIPRPDRSGAVLARVASLSRADFGHRAVRFDRTGAFRPR